MRYFEIGNSFVGFYGMIKIFFEKYFNCVFWGEGGMGRRLGWYWGSNWREERLVRMLF